MKKIIKLLLLLVLLTSCTNTNNALPIPELEEGLRGEQFGIDKNINEKTIDNYLNRNDSIYRDMRMLKDEANYEAIGGDSYLSGLVKGFEVIPYPYLVNVSGLPEEVGNTYSGPTLFTQNEKGYEANFVESMDILEYLFPKDKYIFLMCGGGGYAGMTKNMLIELGWDPNKIYNTGGYWFYEGNNKVQIKREENNETYYDFHKVAYHYLDFSILHPVDGYDYNPKQDDGDDNTSEFNIPVLTTEELDNKMNNKETFALYISLPGCSTCAKFNPIISKYNEYKLIDIYTANYSDIDLEDEVIKQIVKYTPTVLLFKDGNLLDALLPDSDDDLPHYKSVKSLSEWFNENLGLDIVDDDLSNDIEKCEEEACKIG